jgi:cytochrome c553
MTAKFAALTLAAVLGWTGSAHAAGTVEAGQAKSATCMACHGMDGNSANPEWPSLAGQHPSYIVKQLRHFKSNERQNPLMSPMAMILTDQDMEDLAAYFGSQTLRPTGETKPSKLALGQLIFRAGIAARGVPSCAGCHGPSGRGIPGAAFPAIGGQHAVYAASQLRGYRSAARATDPNSMMRTIAAKLTDEEIDAVASYLQGMR